MFKAAFSASSRILAAGMLVFVLSGCNKGHGIKLYPVKGVVFLNGQPAKDVNVMFTPVTPIQLEGRNIGSSAVTEEDGSYRLMTFEENDGAPAGEYQVAISFPMNRYNKNQSGIDRLKGKYSNPKTSGLTAKVEEKNNEIPPFQLKAEVMPVEKPTKGGPLYKKNRDR
jgi:hypothetical protein